MADRPHGLLAAFDTPEALVHAARHLREKGYSALDALTPYPVEGLKEPLRIKKSRIPIFAFIGGLIGGLSILGLELYSVLVDYPINVGGRPLASLTAFVVPAFECTILGAALTGFVAMLVGNGLPRLYHPVFNAPSFSLARGDRFYLVVGADDPQFDRAKLRRMFRTLHAVSIDEVAP